MRLLAIDPGGTTGMARYDSDGKQDPPFASFELSAMEAIETVNTIVSSPDRATVPDLVICEAFIISGQTLKKTRKGPNETIETIGAVRYLCFRWDVPFKLQAPFQRDWATNARLAKMGWRNPTPGGHCDDAARHLLVAAVTYGLIDPAIFLEEDNE